MPSSRPNWLTSNRLISRTRRVRRPLLALLVLLAAFAIGYGVRAAHRDHASTPPTVPASQFTSSHTAH